MKNALVGVSNGRLELELWFVSCQANNGGSDGRTDGRKDGWTDGRTDGRTRALAQSANAFSQIKNRSFIWLGGGRLDPPLPNKKPIFYLGEGGCSVEGALDPHPLFALAQRANPLLPNKKPVFYLGEGGLNDPPFSQIKIGCYLEEERLWNFSPHTLLGYSSPTRQSLPSKKKYSHVLWS